MPHISFHHLTPTGWVEDKTPPAATVETWIRTYERSPTGRRLINYNRTWWDSEFSPSDLVDLRNKFPRPEGNISGADADILWEVVDPAPRA